MPRQDKQHFNDYSPQNEAKHQILEKYLPVYLKILKGKARVSSVHYIDGFAGRGTYGEDQSGSPLRVLDILEQTGVASCSAMSLVEQDAAHHADLIQVLTRHPVAKKLAFPIQPMQGRFDKFVDEFLSHPIYAKGKVATFSFIDPCGIDGVRMVDLKRLLSKPYGELLLFFNYDGLNRTLGGINKGTHPARVLVDLFGEEKSAKRLLERLKDAALPFDRENIIREEFVHAVRATSCAKYVIPFRFGYEKRDRTSHYLVHCSRHPLGFTVMKDVMWRAGRTQDDDYGSLEFHVQKSIYPELRWDIATQKQKILAYLQRGPSRARVFKVEWPQQPDDMYCSAAYNRMLRDLELEGKIQIYDANNHMPQPAALRRVDTLSESLWIRTTQ